jgi:hypothetical protein
MKAINKFLVIGLVAACLLCSCEDNFDPKIFGSLNPTNYPSTAAEYESFMMLCYSPFTTTNTYWMGAGSSSNQLSWYIPPGGVYRMFDVTSDNTAVWNNGWGGGWLFLSKADFSQCVYNKRESLDDPNVNHFAKTAEITYMTYVIGVLEKAPVNILPEAKREALLGEIHLLRGIQAYYLLHLYGPVPLIMNPEDVSVEEKLKNVERPSLQQMTEWITADLEYACNHIPEKQAEQGRYNRDYARVYMMRHCLNEGSYMSGYYQKVIDMYDELKGKYSLFKSGANPYAELFKIANKFNNEIIMAVSCDANSDGSVKNGNANPFEYYAIPSNAAALDDQGQPTPFFPMGAGWGQVFNVSPKFYDTFELADKRRETIITRYYNTGGIWTDRNTSNWDGFIINKYPVETASYFQATDIPLARWADVLLMYAEAEVRNTNTPSAGAIAAVNEVRSRAGLENLPAAATSGKDAFLDAILTERGHELYYEGMRKIDLIRFNRYAQEVLRTKEVKPTHQYMPLPNYAVEAAESYGKTLQQTYERDGWKADLAAAR